MVSFSCKLFLSNYAFSYLYLYCFSAFPTIRILSNFFMWFLTVSSKLIDHSQGCGLCYQNIKQSLSRDSMAALDSSSLANRYMNRSPSAASELRILPHVTASEGTVFDGYRRVQVIFSPISCMPTDPISDRSFAAFPDFVSLFRTATKGQLVYLTDMREIGTRICDYTNRQGNIPQLSFAGIKKWHKQMAEEQSILQQAVSQLMQRICNDERSTMLTKHILQSIITFLSSYSFHD